MTAPSAHRLIAAYFEQREALGRFLKARLGNGGDVEDLLQDLYLKASAVQDVSEIRDMRAYLYRLASNLMMDRWRSSRRAATRDGAWRDVSHETLGVEDIMDAPSAEAVVAARQRLAILMTTLSTLPAKTQTIFKLHKFEGCSYAEVAARLQISKSSVEKHMMDALRVLSARVPR